jgi:hypothetical protein
MDYVECPECLSAAKRMPVLSGINRSHDFFQCERCRQVSHMPKDASAPPVRFGLGSAAAAHDQRA